MVTSVTPRPDSIVEQDPRPAGEPLLPIAAVERETGLGKDTLRAWERRYGFPVPRRDAAGVRGYPRSLVDRLSLIRRAVLAGHRPGRLLALPPTQLDALLAGVVNEPAPPASVPGAGAPPLLDVREGLAALRTGGAESLRHWLTLGLARTGLASFVVHGVAPLTVAVSEARLAGRVAVHEEHVYSDVVQGVLRSALVPFQAGFERRAPRVLLTTVPDEAHGLGLLMVETMMTLQACPCLSLGTRTPPADIVAAAAAHRVDVVALSLAAGLPSARALPGLGELRASLPVGVDLWVGGASPALRGLRVPGIRLMAGLVEIGEAVADWRKAHPGTAG